MLPRANPNCMKKLLLFLLPVVAPVVDNLQAGDWGKAPVGKEVIAECQDLGGLGELQFDSSYVYKGYRFGGDSVTSRVDYTFEGLALPVTLGVDYLNVVSGNRLTNMVNDELALSLAVALPEFAGIESSLSYTHRFYPEDPNTFLWPSSHGEFGLHLARDLGFATLSFDLFHNTQLPNAWNGAIPTVPNSDTGAWYWELGLERGVDLFGHTLLLGGGVAYADNYWGTAPNLQTGGRSSGWNHYYLRAELPIELNCRTTLTPYLGYVGGPDGWLMDGAPNWLGLSGQSDTLYGGVTLSVAF